MVHGPGKVLGELALTHPKLGGVHFTGSTAVFQHMWATVGQNIANYEGYPRLVGETGGKDFIVAHESADVEALAVAIVRGAFEYQGQKCSACSRVYVPEEMWFILSEKVEKIVNSLKVGNVKDFTCFMGAVIDEKSFDKISDYIQYARDNEGGEVWLGGKCDKSEGYFIEPTVVLATDPKFKLMREEIFGPVVTIYRYPAADFSKTLEICDETSPYALTGAIFARDKSIVLEALEALRYAAGNFYINDKPTGAVVGQQPFGGSRASGTNDKAGSKLNLVRWTSPRTVKETFDPPRSHDYPSMAAE
jgi:1-pyrroline-5-carboxylate dehydrogenase